MKEQLLSTAIKVATTNGLSAVTRNGVARAANVAAGSVSYHFKSSRKLLAAVVAEGLKTRNLRIIGDALAITHPLVAAISEPLRREAAKHVAALVYSTMAK